MELLKKEGLDNVLVLGGGVIPRADIKALKDCGIKEVFGPGTDTKDIVKFIESNI